MEENTQIDNLLEDYFRHLNVLDFIVFDSQAEIRLSFIGTNI